MSDVFLKKTSRELGNIFGGVEYNVGFNRVVLVYASVPIIPIPPSSPANGHPRRFDESLLTLASLHTKPQ